MYCELHARSAFSFLEGASLPEELAEECTRLGLPALALLDADGVYGAPRFHLAAKRLGLRAHIGSEITVSGFTFQVSRSPGQPETRNVKRETSRLPLLADSRLGYQNLCRLITRLKLRAPKHARPEETAATADDLAAHAAGLVCFTGSDDGPLAAALIQGGMEAGRRCLEQLIALFGRDRVYVELQRHYDRAQEARNQAAVALARSLGLPLVATNGVAYATAARRPVLDVFTCLHHHRTLATAGRLLANNSERDLKSAAEMAELFADLPEAIANTEALSARLQFTLADLGYQFPRYPVSANETMDSFLRARAQEGAQSRYGRATPDLRVRARRQIERELALIEKLDLAGYFLIVWDLVRFCREQGILTQGRGSAANSAVCYSLGITAVDPVGMELLFERFLSEERGEWPDIDLDLPSGEQRERVIQYLYQRYGERGAAMTANVITYRGRSAAREVGKVLGFDPETLGRLSATVGHWEYQDPADTRERQFRDAGFDLRHPRIRKFFELCEAVQDLPRHLGQHSGGMVICQGQLDSVVPLEPAAMPGRVVVQWDKEDCADLGIIKVDLLGLGMMAALEDALAFIHRDYGEPVELAHLPPDDPAVYAALEQADTVGMFQVESRAQMSCLPRLRPKSFYDIVVEVAIIRPGPIVGQMVNPYLKRRQGREPVVYPHASLEPVLARTLGVPLFQEQLLRMAMIAAGFSGGEAEELRRAMGFKRSQARMREIEQRLRAGMTRNRIAPAAQEQIVQSITSFALYGFPESHAASFALLAYASAYLKCHYLAAFTAALLNNQPMGFYHPATLVKDAQRHGLKFRPIDVTRSEWLCTLEPGESSAVGRRPSANPEQFAVRLGLRYARGLREEAARALLAERARAPFTSIDDLARRLPDLRKNELVLLAEIGALNSVPSSRFPVPSKKLHRRDALWQVERAVRRPGPLLRDLPQDDSASPLAPLRDEERLVADFRGTGLTVGPHPMAYQRARLDALGVRRASELARLPQGRRVRVAGCVIARQRPGSARGFVFLSLEDETGIANAILTPDVYTANRFTVVSESFLLVEGALQNQDGVVSVKAARVLPLAVTRAPTSSHDFH
ncbi:MAG TPA: error-prone DNA polymerase [Terriglobales bacterium]|jgi:error-prone DNA polymerase|nr:error-prone DNA polymerase [Terriglobales bacterium]